MKNKISNRKIEKAILIRKNFFNFFKNHGVNFASNNLSKPYINELSPGCKTCIKGTWSCIHINFLCTHNCFFCPQDRKVKKERNPNVELLEFKKSEEYIDYLKKFNFEGIGFSGGEPFLVFNKTVNYIQDLRKIFGSKHYIWLYTNGDLVTEEKLMVLNRTGLNEIRFNLSAINYDLEPVKLAARHINTVTVEIPAIPEDLEKVKSLLKKFEEIGVKYVNIHQLYATKYNFNSLLNKGYTFIKTNPSNPILESELAAFELLKYGINSKTKIGINYCSCCYKERFQSQALRKRYASFFKNKNNIITKTGYIRELNIGDFNQEISLNDLPNILEKNNIFDKKIKLVYYDFVLGDFNKENTVKFEIGDQSLSLKKIEVNRINLENKTSIVLFKKLFIENKKFTQIIDEISKEYGLSDYKKVEFLEDLKSFYLQFADLEYMSKELPTYC